MIDGPVRKLRRVSFAVSLAGITLALVIITSASRCRNPDDLEPPGDTLVAAPAAPGLVSPVDKYVFMPPVFPYDAVLDWDTAAGAEIYEVEITRGGSAPYSVLQDTDSCRYRIYLDSIYFHQYSWRVRASSSKWIEGVTAWSDPRAFEVRWRPAPPALLLPPDGSIFYADSMPYYLECRWDSTSDEQFYEIRYTRDTTLMEQAITQDRLYGFVAYDTGTYCWTVRAGSNLWQQYTNWAYPWTFVVADTTVK